MPYCINCGRKLNDGEVCNCTAPAQGAPVQQIPPQQGYAQPPYSGYPQSPQPYPNVQPRPINYQFAYDGTPLPPPPKPSRKWILGIIIPFAVAFVAMAVIILAILVPSVTSYKEKAKQSSINSVARGINTATYDTINALKIDQDWVMGDYIICSDSSKNVYVSFDEEKFYKKEEFNFAELDKYEYFIVVEEGKPVYTAVSESWNDKKAYIGTYPTKYVISTKRYENVTYSVNGTGDVIKAKDTLNDVYNAAYKEFNEELIPKHDYKER